MGVARNVLQNPRLVPGGGALEMELSCRLTELSTKVEGIH
jgi:T-complex protein 1 subunit gamma